MYSSHFYFNSFAYTHLEETFKLIEIAMNVFHWHRHQHGGYQRGWEWEWVEEGKGNQMRVTEWDWTLDDEHALLYTHDAL